MTEIPDTLVLLRHRDQKGLGRHGPHVRRVVLGAIAAVSVLGLLNVFGQRPATTVASAPAATLAVNAPSTLRSGLLWSAQFRITARQDLKKATLVLDEGWGNGIGINTIEPSPLGQASRDGRIAFDLGHIAKGSTFVLFMQFQVNATTVAWRRSQNVELDDGNTKVLILHHHVTIYP
ncbi:MAG TPA: hypothetical protein VGL76_07830 [Gaiellaceae bacterium]